MTRDEIGLKGEASTVRSTVIPEKSVQPKKQQPLYLTILSHLRTHTSNGNLQDGAVIKEGSLATVFGVSRAPVRRALHLLEQEQVLRPAEGQGFVVGLGAEKGALSATELRSIFDDKTEVARTATWESIYDNLLLDVTNCLPFGTYRISETKACDYFSVGRTALRESLGKLQDKGFLAKSNRSHWIAGPLTARDIHEAFEVRGLLEPAALRESAPHFGKSTFREMREKITRAIADQDSTTPADVEQIEVDLHRVLLANCGNQRMLEAIERNLFPFIVNRIFRWNFGIKSDQAALEDQAQILDQLHKEQTEVACTMLAAHLASAEKTTLAKLRVLSILPRPETAPYLTSIH